MDDASTQMVWIGSPGGELEHVAKSSLVRPAAPLTSGQLHQRARLALMLVDKVLNNLGWKCNALSQGSSSLSLRVSHEVHVLVAIREASKIAYVTTNPSKRRLDGSLEAKAEYASQNVRSRYLLQVEVTKDNLTACPEFIEVSGKPGDDVTQDIAKSILITLRNTIGLENFTPATLEEAWRAQSQLTCELD